MLEAAEDQTVIQIIIWWKSKWEKKIAKIQKIPRIKTRGDVEKLHKDVAQRDKYQKVLGLKLKQKKKQKEK